MLVGASTVIAAPTPHHLGRIASIAVAALCAFAMGMQNSTARRLAVADLTTTVLTMTPTVLVLLETVIVASSLTSRREAPWQGRPRA